VAAPCLSLPCFSYKYRGEHERKGAEKIEERGQRRREEREQRARVIRPEKKKKKRRPEEEERREKQGERKKKKNRGVAATNTAGNAGTTTPPLATTGQLRRLQVNPPPFSFAFTSSLAMQEMHSARLCRRGEAGCCAHAQEPANVGWVHVVGPGSAQPMYLGLIRPISKKKSKIFVS
jgi:hypothetical protein